MPNAYAYPADMRATRDLMRRRLLFVRQRGSLLAHIQITHHQYNVDPPGKRITYRSNREGLGEAFEDPTVRQNIASDLTVADHLEVVIGELELAVLRQARVHDPNAYALLTSVPGIGKVLALTILYEIHDISRFPSVRDFASYCRLVKCAAPLRRKEPRQRWEQDRERLPQVGLLRSRRALRRQVRTGPHRPQSPRAQVREAQGAVRPRPQARSCRLFHARPQTGVRPAALHRGVTRSSRRRGVSPSPNSSHSGWSPDIDASPSRSGMSRRGRTGIVGTNTRQRSPLDWTPLSLLRLHRRHPLFFVVSAPHPSPHILAPCSGTHMPAPLLNGTTRGNRCVSRWWERLLLPYPDTTARDASRAGHAGRTSIGVLVETSRTGTRNQVGTQRSALKALSRYSHRLERGRRTDVSLLDSRGPDRCWAAPRPLTSACVRCLRCCGAALRTRHGDAHAKPILLHVVGTGATL